MPRVRVERTSPALQAGACTTQAARARCDRATCRDRVIIIDYSVVILTPSPPCRCRPAVSYCSGDRRFTCGAVSRSSGRRNRTLIARSRISRPTVRRSLIDLFVSPEGFEPSPHRVKAECAAVTPRAQDGCRGRAFELLLHLHHVGALRIELRWCRSTRGLQPRPEPRRSARPKTRRAAREDLSRAAPESFRLFSLSLRVWSLPFVGRGARLTLDTHDDPVTGEVRLAGPIATRAYLSLGALAPCDSGCGRDQHDGYERDANARPGGSQLSGSRTASTLRSHGAACADSRCMKRRRFPFLGSACDLAGSRSSNATCPAARRA